MIKYTVYKLDGNAWIFAGKFPTAWQAISRARFWHGMGLKVAIEEIIT